jgi:chromosome segregation protein
VYLSKLEMLGFKSFANRTILNFEPGMTAVVGPNGCGKSNISDAIRWVLGEQSAKAMRGKKMQDCIFEGTDTKQRLGMAEVSLTLSDCEQELGVDYNEVTITRRVYRSGESEYLVNKSRCRLKDVQRLFMDTGIGTNSYSVMEQGRIDYILSARPEDRRAVFEEASGITKFKSDKKEALRKLEHTEANLLRLDDIIREVKRQIISLQRQAGKARRYKDLREEVRGLDIFLARKKIATLDEQLAQLKHKHSELGAQIASLREELQRREALLAEMRTKVDSAEQAIETAMRNESELRAQLNKNRELIDVNADRIEELKSLAERDSRDADSARANLAEHSQTLEKLVQELTDISAERDGARAELDRSMGVLREAEDQVEELGRQIHSLRSETIDLENRYSKLQNEQTEIDARERSTTIRRERLAAELSELESASSLQADARGKVAEQSEQLAETARQSSERLELLGGQRQQRRQHVEQLRAQIAQARSERAGIMAKIELLEDSEKQGEGFSGGARELLRNPAGLGLRTEAVIGSLADQLAAEPDYAKALEAVLRTWMDAVVMSDMDSAVAALTRLAEMECGSVRILAQNGRAGSPAPERPAMAESLIEHVEYPAAMKPLLENLIGNVFVVESLETARHLGRPDLVFATRGGKVFSGRGVLELWMSIDETANPLARRQKIREWQGQVAQMDARIAASESELESLNADEQSVAAQIDAERRQLEERRTAAAIAREELQRLEREIKKGAERLETVKYELAAIADSDSSTRDRRAQIQGEMENLRTRQSEIRENISNLNERLRSSEQRRSQLLGEVTDKRVAFTEKEQRFLNLQSRRENLSARVVELKHLIAERSAGIDSYQERIARLEGEVAKARDSIAPLEERAAACADELEQARAARSELHERMAATGRAADEQRGRIEELQSGLSRTEIQLTEQRMRRENIVERVSDDYNITPEAMLKEPAPQWEGGVEPSQEEIESKVFDIKDKLEKMGPVNLVAIEEHRELEDRHEFLRQQHEDLSNSREQLLSMIKHINKTTTEMFMKSFNSINASFQELFKEIFGGGSAQLELSEEGDILESGIEIIARPPGKKLQTVSLLSGGERTMTAIALLFALYEEKPSAFCLLDELDAALDESNIDRFLRVVQKFLQRSQFVVITHNQKTIAAADVLYGVTMEERGVSKIVSVKFHGKQLDLPVVSADER